MYKIVIGLFLMVSMAFLRSEEKIVQANHIEICYEAFGQKNDRAFLLIMGAGGQGIIWPTAFCEKLSQQGFYVIRYDQRDAGHSTCVDYEVAPYDLLDMAKDAIGLLDVLEIKRAHLFGLSMGGPIAELMAVHFPDRVISLGMVGSHFDYQPYNETSYPTARGPGAFSTPDENYLKEIDKILKEQADTFDQKVEQKTKIWTLLYGSLFPPNEKALVEMMEEYMRRAKHPDQVKNYRTVLLGSEERVKAIHRQVLVPTVIFQGTEDPILGTDHAIALQEAIKGSHLYLVEGLGHLIHPHFFDFLIDRLASHAKNE
jgi:pimeloyl-ACP methyl ester carboxylesterase